MDTESVTLGEVRTQASFYAEVMAILVEDGTNFLTKYGIASGTTVVTNHYVVWLREPGGQKHVISGKNATTQDLDAVRKLGKGKSFTFPDAVVK
jgi:hypothetical protein